MVEGLELAGVLPETHGAYVVVFWDDFEARYNVIGWSVEAYLADLPCAARQYSVTPLLLECTEGAHALCVVEVVAGVVQWVFPELASFSTEAAAFAYGREQAAAGKARRAARRKAMAK